MVTVVEIYLINVVGDAIGGWDTLALLVIDSVVGAWLVRREGLSIFAKVQNSLAAGELPTDTLIDGLLVLFAGALMLTPGFLTDGFGLLLLIPPSRAVVRRLLKRRFAGRIQFGAGAFGGAQFTDVGWADVNHPDSDEGQWSDDPDEPPSPPIELGPVPDS